jgi:GTPase SAR1 family protein
VAIIVYDITVKASFDVLKTWIKELRQYGPKNIGFHYLRFYFIS